MHANNLDLADFCVYTNKMVHITEVQYDLEYVQLVLEKCDEFFQEYLLPEILTRSHEEDTRSYIDV